MAIVLVTRDLATSSRVEGAALRQHVELRSVGSAEQAAASCSRAAIRLVIVDLTVPGLDIAALVAALQSSSRPPNIVAFGPHVHEAVLAAAIVAGCDEVLSRGRFMAQLDEIVSRAAGAS